MAAPTVPVYVRYPTAAQRVFMNIADHRKKIFFRIDEDRFISAAKQRSVTMMNSVKLLRIDPIEMAHRPGQTCRRGRQQEMVVVVHQTIGIDLNLPQSGHVGEQVEKSLPSFVFDEDITAGVGPVPYLIVYAPGFDP